MPTVYIFAAFRSLPRPVSLTLWLLLPVLGAWLIAGRRPWVLLFGPLFGHFVGGQSAGLAMLGLWGWRRFSDPDKISGGLWLGLLAFKPQLAVFPVLFAGWQWLNYLRRYKRIPLQFLGWAGAFLGWWMVGELFLPGWVSQWLANPRPISERALAGILPRTLVVIGITESTPILFWGLLGGGAAGILLAAWWFNRRRMPFDHWLLASAIFNPLLHDYDLIQLIPLLDSPLRQRWAVLSSIPLWGVILFAYTNNHAWYVVSLIPPILLCASLLAARNKRLQAGCPPDNPGRKESNHLA